MKPHDRLSAAIRAASADGGPAIVAFLTAGFPEAKKFREHLHAVGLQRQRFLVQELGEGHRHRLAVAVVAVGDRVDDGHRPGQRELHFFGGVGAQQLRFSRMHAAF